ncbi:hypothetical protein DPMN_016550 [Dreissena polymorpha]|uniref:Uncharacterized protein n=1 Tax=Dreissena polymorpha TaxID=45954 RepID=A0A9D4N9W7_DREPO|nr:hypothetical protein DPMN_016550 [Dreissena polymorpha]
MEGCQDVIAIRRLVTCVMEGCQDAIAIRRLVTGVNWRDVNMPLSSGNWLLVFWRDVKIL